MPLPTSPIRHFVNGNAKPSGHADGYGPHGGPGGHGGHGGHDRGGSGGQHVHLMHHHSPKIEKMAVMKIDHRSEVGTEPEPRRHARPPAGRGGR